MSIEYLKELKTSNDMDGDQIKKTPMDILGHQIIFIGGYNIINNSSKNEDILFYLLTDEYYLLKNIYKWFNLNSDFESSCDFLKNSRSIHRKMEFLRKRINGINLIDYICISLIVYICANDEEINKFYGLYFRFINMYDKICKLLQNVKLKYILSWCHTGEIMEHIGVCSSMTIDQIIDKCIMSRDILRLLYCFFILAENRCFSLIENIKEWFDIVLEGDSEFNIIKSLIKHEKFNLEEYITVSIMGYMFINKKKTDDFYKDYSKYRTIPKLKSILRNEYAPFLIHKYNIKPNTPSTELIEILGLSNKIKIKINLS